jgi:hypothetical protein
MADETASPDAVTPGTPAWDATLDDDGMQFVVLYVLTVQDAAGNPVTLRLSSHPYGNDPAGPYLAIIAEGLVYTEALTPEGAPRISASDIKVENTAHEYDAWRDYIFEGGTMLVYLGDVRWAFSEFSLECKLVLEDIDASGSDEESGATLTIKLRDAMERMNTAMTEQTLADGSLCPQTFGEVPNITPKLTNANTNEFVYHTGATEGLIAARVEGRKRTNVTQNIAAGKFTVTDAIAGAITASVQGDKTGGVYRNTIGALCRLFAQSFGVAATRFTDAEIDIPTFTAFDVANPQAVGLHLTERTLVVEACARLASSVRGQVVPSPVGKLRLLQYAVPATATAEIRQQHYELNSLVEVKRHPVLGAVNIGYCQNMTPQPAPQANIPDSNKAALALPWRESKASDATVLARRKLSGAAKMRETRLINVEGADAEAARDLADNKVQRTTYGITGFPAMLRRTLGQGVTLYGDYFGLQNGRVGQITLRTLDFHTIAFPIEVRV